MRVLHHISLGGAGGKGRLENMLVGLDLRLGHRPSLGCRFLPLRGGTATHRRCGALVELGVGGALAGPSLCAVSGLSWPRENAQAWVPMMVGRSVPRAASKLDRYRNTFLKIVVSTLRGRTPV